MRRIFASAAALCLVGAAAPSVALKCTVTSQGTTILDSFVVKPDRSAFCVGDVCWTLVVEGGALTYRCPPATDRSGHCAPYPFTGSANVISSGGPFVYEIWLRIDPVSGRVDGEAAGTVGDRAPQPFQSSIAGACESWPG